MSEEEYQENQEDPNDIIDQLLRENKQLQGQNTKLSSDLSSFSAVNKDQNIAQYQIDDSELLEKLFHFFKGEYLGYDNEGSEVWIIHENEDMRPFNSYGVATMMGIVTKYIGKLTSLSFYKEERINEIIADMGDMLIKLILSSYERMGMDTYHKKVKFEEIVETTCHMIESCYRKAILGHTLEEINQSRIVTQTDSYGNRLMQNTLIKQPSKSRLWPF